MKKTLRSFQWPELDLNYQTYAHEALRLGIIDLTKRQGFRGRKKDETLQASKALSKIHL